LIKGTARTIMKDAMELWYSSAYEAARLYESIAAFSRRAAGEEPTLTQAPEQPGREDVAVADAISGADNSGILRRRTYRPTRQREWQALEVRERSFWT
jgi:hypothetical protein